MEGQQAREFTGVWIPRHIIEDSRLKPVDRLIFAEIACFNECWQSNLVLAKRAGCSEATAKRSVSRLKSLGYIRQTSFDGRVRKLICLNDPPAQNDQADSANCTDPPAQNDPLDNNIENKEKTTNSAGAELASAVRDRAVDKSKAVKSQTERPDDEAVEYGKSELNNLFAYWHQQVGYPITNRLQANRFACSNLVKKHGIEAVQRFIDGVAIAHGDSYAPRIADFCGLQYKLHELIAWGKQKGARHATASF